jgi:predicted nucleic acid-binding protein
MSVDFLDSNVILYSIDQADASKLRVAKALVGDALERKSAMISFQVVQETLDIAQRKFEVPISNEDAQALLQTVLIPLMQVLPSQTLYLEAMRIKDRYQFGFYDSLIVAAALSQKCKRLYTEDMQDGQIIEGLKIVNPFKN